MSKYPFDRHIKNGLVDGGAQLRFAIPMIVVLLMSSATMAAIIWQFSQLAAATEGTPLLEANRRLLLNQMADLLITTSSIGLVITSLVALYLWAIFSHRIFGPSVPILRMIHNLEDGNYSHRIHLRKRDELKPIADALNDLAEKLESSKQR